MGAAWPRPAGLPGAEGRLGTASQAVAATVRKAMAILARGLRGPPQGQRASPKPLVRGPQRSSAALQVGRNADSRLGTRIATRHRPSSPKRRTTAPTRQHVPPPHPPEALRA